MVGGATLVELVEHQLSDGTVRHCAPLLKYLCVIVGHCWFCMLLCGTVGVLDGFYIDSRGEYSYEIYEIIS